MKRPAAQALDPFHRPLRRRGGTPPDDDAPYLEQRVIIADEILRDAAGFAVMMPWEAPLMEAHAAFICADAGGTVLNVGFGMGIVDAAIERRGPHKRHVIVEAHPQVVERAREFARDRPNVQVIHSKWQDSLPALAALAPFDGIFWDTYEETVEDFIPLLPDLLRRPAEYEREQGGRFSFCNVYQPHDAVRHVAYSLYLSVRLRPCLYDLEINDHVYFSAIYLCRPMLCCPQLVNHISSILQLCV